MRFLGVNIDHIATVRQQRQCHYPNLLEAARVVQDAGAHSITVHLREDRRHIQDQDVWDLRKAISLPLNLEMRLTQEMLDFALQVRPYACCLVEENPQERTTTRGLNVKKRNKILEKIIDALHQINVRVSLFIDPDAEQIEAAKNLGAKVVELHTGDYANAKTVREITTELARLKEAAELAASLGLKVHAGHGLHYDNISGIIMIPQIEEFNIGYSIVARSFFVGLHQATKEMLTLIRRH